MVFGFLEKKMCVFLGKRGIDVERREVACTHERHHHAQDGCSIGYRVAQYTAYAVVGD